MGARVATRPADRRTPKPPHGTWARYCAKCPCPLCAAAGSEYGNAYRAAKKAGLPFTPPEHLSRKAEPLSFTAPIPAGIPGTVTRNYTFRAAVSPSTSERLTRVFGHARYVYNAYVAYARAEYAAGLKHPSGYDGCKHIVTRGRANPDTAWLNEARSQVLREAVLDAGQAYANFFTSLSGKRKGRRVGRPKMRTRTGRQRATFGQESFSINGAAESTRGSGGRLWLSHVGYVTVNWHRPLPAAPSSVTISRSPDGRYRVTFTVTMPAPRPMTPTRKGRAAGVDLGLTHFAAIVYSDGTRETIENPRHLRHAERQIARLSRELARRQKGSRNRARTKARLARAHSRVRNLRTNHHQQLAKRLIRENQSVSVEDLNIAGLARTRLAKSITDAGWGAFLTQLGSLAVTHDRTFTKVDRFFPSSQLCSVCDMQTGKKPLSVREFTCPGCGALLDRDFNAAVNIMVAAGHAETRNACGRDVRLRLAEAVPSEAGTHPTPHYRAGRRKVSAGARAPEAILRSQ